MSIYYLLFKAYCPAMQSIAIPTNHNGLTDTSPVFGTSSYSPAGVEEAAGVGVAAGVGAGVAAGAGADGVLLYLDSSVFKWPSLINKVLASKL